MNSETLGTIATERFLQSVDMKNLSTDPVDARVVQMHQSGA